MRVSPPPKSARSLYGASRCQRSICAGSCRLLMALSAISGQGELESSRSLASSPAAEVSVRDSLSCSTRPSRMRPGRCAPSGAADSARRPHEGYRLFDSLVRAISPGVGEFREQYTPAPIRSWFLSDLAAFAFFVTRVRSCGHRRQCRIGEPSACGPAICLEARCRGSRIWQCCSRAHRVSPRPGRGGGRNGSGASPISIDCDAGRGDPDAGPWWRSTVSLEFRVGAATSCRGSSSIRRCSASSHRSPVPRLPLSADDAPVPRRSRLRRR